MSHQRQLSPPCSATLAAAVVAALLPTSGWAAPKVEFNADMLFGSASASRDLSRYETGGVLPGTYNADILLNGIRMGRKDVTARLGDDDAVHFCLDPALFELMGLNEKRLEALRESEEGRGLLPIPDETACSSLATYVPGASTDFDSGEQALNITIPQLYLARNPRGWVDPALWDSGITAATLGYGITHSRQRNGAREVSRTSMTVDAGLNLGEWRLRHSGYLNQTDGGDLRYQAGASYLQRNLPSLGAQLTVGESSTLGDMLQAVNYRGVAIATDARMLPDDQREFAPVVRGVAQTNARVTVRQRGYVIRETTVAPGPFEIEDLVIASASGDLEVEITEADGRVEAFTIPFTAMPQLLRPGQQRYTLTAGQLRGNTDVDEPGFVEATLRRGLSNGFTGYGGFTAATGYASVVLGAAWNTQVGAFSGDVTLSNARLSGNVIGAGERRRGQSYRLAYNKSLFSDNTNITMAAYRYSTSDFLSLTDAMRLRGSTQEAGYDLVGRQRSRLDLTVNQRLAGGKGHLYFTGSTADYWSQNRRQTSFSLGYSNRIGRASYSLSARRTLESSLFAGGAAKTSNSIFLNVSVPLGAASRAPRLDLNADRDSQGRSGQGIGITGTTGKEWQGSYNAALSRNGHGNRFSVGGNYQLAKAQVGGSFTRSDGTSQLQVSASGGLVLHSGGVTLSQRLGETIGLVHIPGAANVAVGSMAGVKTDARGYAVVPHLSPFRSNELQVDPTNLSMDVELGAGSLSAVPNAGAVVKVVLPTSVGRSALIEALMADGAPLPFGNDVFDEGGNVVGVVGQGSRLWVRGLNQAGALSVQTSSGQICRIPYRLPDASADQLLSATCTAATTDMPLSSSSH